MVRVVALFVAVTLFLASPAFAQSFASTSSPGRAATVRIDLSAKAAGIDTMAAAPRPVKRPAAADAAATRKQTKGAFWKSPWLYAAIVGVIIVVAVAYSDEGDAY
jgi:hypothetical protein